jgi:hypothetical protein
LSNSNHTTTKFFSPNQKEDQKQNLSSLQNQHLKKFDRTFFTPTKINPCPEQKIQAGKERKANYAPLFPKNCVMYFQTTGKTLIESITPITARSVAIALSEKPSGRVKYSIYITPFFIIFFRNRFF